MCIDIKFTSPFPDFNSLYSQIDFSNIRLPEFNVPKFTLPDPLFPSINMPSMDFNFFITDIQNFNLMAILNKFLGKMLGFLGLGFNFLPKMPVLNLSFPDLLSYISGNANALYALAFSKRDALLAYFPKMYSGFNIPELEIVNIVRMLTGNFLSTIVNFASNIVNMVIGKVTKVFKVGLPVFSFPVLPTVQSILQLAKNAIGGIIPNLPSLPSFPNVPTVPNLNNLNVPNFNDFNIPVFPFDMPSLPSLEVDKLMSLDFLKSVLVIPGFKFPSFPDVSTFFSGLNVPEINLMEKISKIATEMSTFLLKKATDFFNNIIGRFIGALSFSVPTFTIPCPPNFHTN